MSAFVARASQDPLERERQEIERRRARFAERKTRILDAKTRTIGVDLNALDAQVREKEARDRLEKDQKAQFDEEALNNARALEINREIARVQEQQRLAELAFYQRRQAAEKKERDLLSQQVVNPLSEKSEVFLNFAGEDRQYKDRQKAQQLQQQQWIAQQLLISQEKEDRLRQEAEEFSRYQSTMAALHESLVAQREGERREKIRQLADYNKQLKQAKDNRMRQSRAAENDANQAELSSTLHSDFLNERTAAYGNANVNFKGFSVDERQEILNEQLRQQEEARILKEANDDEEREYAAEQERVRRELLRIDRERAAAELQKKLSLKSEQSQQHKEKQVREDYLKNVVYKNPVAEEYFAQFGTSHR